MELPPEILFKIFERLPSGSLVTLTRVNRLWRAISEKLLYTTVEHSSWKPRRVSSCLRTLASSHDPSLAPTVRHLHLRLWSIDPEVATLLIDALSQTMGLTKLKLSMSEPFSQHFEMHLLQQRIIATERIDEPQPEAWNKRFLPQLQHLEISPGYLPFQLAAGRPVRSIISATHIQYEALQRLLPFLQRSLGPLQTIHLNLTGRDTKIASSALKNISRKLPCLTNVFFNFFVSKRSHPIRSTPDLLEDLGALSSLHSVELLLSRHARSPDPYLYSHFAAVHTLKATTPHLTHVILDSIHWQYCPPRTESQHTPSTSIASSNSSPHSSSPPEEMEQDDSRRVEDTSRVLYSRFDDTTAMFAHAAISSGTYGWSPEPSDARTHAWWLSQYGGHVAAHNAMLSLWGPLSNMNLGKKDPGSRDYVSMGIPEPQDIGAGLYPHFHSSEQSMSNDSMSIYEHEHDM